MARITKLLQRLHLVWIKLDLTHTYIYIWKKPTSEYISHYKSLLFHMQNTCHMLNPYPTFVFVPFYVINKILLA
jgi:hypothetical protein